jgi:hypothetical protein
MCLIETDVREALKGESHCDRSGKGDNLSRDFLAELARQLQSTASLRESARFGDGQIRQAAVP